MSENIDSRYGQRRTITQINTNQLLVEGDSSYLRCGFENDPSCLTYVDFEGGPFIHIGNSFNHHGIVTNIQHIESEQDNYAMIKITVKN